MFKRESTNNDTAPLAVTVNRACELSGLGATTIWGLLRDGRLKRLRVPGVDRTLVDFASLRELLATPSESTPPRRPRGRPRKIPAQPQQVEATR